MNLTPRHYPHALGPANRLVDGISILGTAKPSQRPNATSRSTSCYQCPTSARLLTLDGRRRSNTDEFAAPAMIDGNHTGFSLERGYYGAR